jgi:hypothetical protein
MEGRVRIQCAECGLTREVSGEIPEEYTDCFVQVIREDGFVPRPGVAFAFVCGKCVMRYAGHETMDDEEKIRGR